MKMFPVKKKTRDKNIQIKFQYNSKFSPARTLDSNVHFNPLAKEFLKSQRFDDSDFFIFPKKVQQFIYIIRCKTSATHPNGQNKARYTPR